MANDDKKKQRSKHSYLDSAGKKNARRCRALHGPNSDKCPGTPKGKNKDVNGNKKSNK